MAEFVDDSGPVVPDAQPPDGPPVGAGWQVVDVDQVADAMARALAGVAGDGPLIGPPVPGWDDAAGDDDDRGGLIG